MRVDALLEVFFFSGCLHLSITKCIFCIRNSCPFYFSFFLPLFAVKTLFQCVYASCHKRMFPLGIIKLWCEYWKQNKRNLQLMLDFFPNVYCILSINFPIKYMHKLGSYVLIIFVQI